ncbi:MAG: FHA domain-containing protein, partial [Ruminococcus sp.]
VSVLTMFGKARQEKEIEQLRWDKVSAHMALYDNARRVVIPLEADEILVGRHGAADIRFTDMSVSRYHAVLYVSNGVWSVMDLGSKSGTYVNGRKIRSQVKLKDMDEIRLEQNLS